MKYVLDSCVALKWFLPEVDSPISLQIRDRYRSGALDLLAPDVFPVEMAHAISRAERQLRITQAEGQTHFRAMYMLLPRLSSYLPLLPRAYELSSRSRIGIYDCLYVALAEREDCELITADDRLKRNPPHAPIVLLSSIP
jgi:predicted nucleic acid-binding protein